MQANNKMQELHKQLERLGGEQLQLETRITELLPYQSEVARLKGDLVKMQVRLRGEGAIGRHWQAGGRAYGRLASWLGGETTPQVPVVMAD